MKAYPMDGIDIWTGGVWQMMPTRYSALALVTPPSSLAAFYFYGRRVLGEFVIVSRITKWMVV